MELSDKVITFCANREYWIIKKNIRKEVFKIKFLRLNNREMLFIFMLFTK